MGLLARVRKTRRSWWILLAVALLCAVQVWRWGRPVETEFVLATAPAPDTREWRIERRASPAEIWIARDTDGDGVADHYETPQGAWRRPGAASAPPDGGPRRWLVVCLDGAPLDLLERLWQRGRFREFYPPSAVVSAFPSDSEAALTEALHAAPIAGYEHLYFDRAANRLRGGVMKTLTGRDIPYLAHFDYVAPGWHKVLHYPISAKSLRADLGRLRRRFRESGAEVFHAHVSGADAIFHLREDAEIEALLGEFEALVRELYLAGRGELGVVLWSDHGNTRAVSRGVPLDALLASRGWRRRDRIEAPRDAVIPAYGLVGFFAVYCRVEAVEDLAQDLAALEGADLVIHRLQGDAPERYGAVILGADGARAALRWTPDGSRYRYEAARGDPLELLPVLEQLRTEGRLSEDGWASDAGLFAATARAWYPDAAARIRGWATDHVRNPSDIVVSLKPGWYQGKGTFDKLVTMQGTHGALERTSSLGFAMSTMPLAPALRLAGLLPPDLRKPRITTDGHR